MSLGLSLGVQAHLGPVMRHRSGTKSDAIGSNLVVEYKSQCNKAHIRSLPFMDSYGNAIFLLELNPSALG